MNPSTKELAQFAAETAKAAGQALLDRFGAALEVQTKDGNPRDLVTDADLAAERAIIGAIARRFPDHGVLSEEAGSSGPASDYLWVIDPLDGTTNFSQGIPFFAVSVALLKQGAPVVGVVYHPTSGELFYAQRGGGAFVGGRPLAVSPQGALERAMVCVEWGKSEASLDRGLRDLVRVTRRANKLRALGSAALNLAYVAAGRLDAFVVNGLHPWDVAAGALLVEEAGGSVTPSAWGRIADPSGLLVATNATLHDGLLNLLRRSQTG